MSLPNYCGCCGRVCAGDGLWCADCLPHVLPATPPLVIPGLAVAHLVTVQPHDRTYEAQHGMPCPFEELDYDADPTEADCFHCGGDGWVECDDPIQCTRAHSGDLHPCASCGGSGLAKDMTIW